MTEFKLHCAVADYLRVALSDDYRILHVPMYAPNAKRGALNKRMGASPGWPDFFVWGPHKDPIGIELKTPGGRLNGAQRDLHAWAKRHRKSWHVCTSVDDVIGTLRAHGITLRAT